jgi:uncharacterized protein DUF6098
VLFGAAVLMFRGGVAALGGGFLGADAFFVLSSRQASLIAVRAQAQTRAPAGHTYGRSPHETGADGHSSSVLRRYEDLPTIGGLDELAELVEHSSQSRDLYVRWSRGPAGEPRARSSRDSLTGVPLPGLSVNSLAVEQWWGDRPVRLWVARRLYDYQYLKEVRGEGTRPWVLVGDVCGRGPDNELLVRCRRPMGWISGTAMRESVRVVAAQGSEEWGPLDRRTRT